MTGTRDDDDGDWVEALAGRPRAGADPATLAEARLLREAVRAWPATGAEAGLPAHEAEADALIARARAAGLLQTGRRWCAGCGARGRRLLDTLRGPRGGAGFGLALAAVVAVLVFGVLRPGPDADERGEPVLRGAADGQVWLLRADDPQALRERIAADLAAAGVAVTRYERLGRYGLDAELLLPAAPALLDTLRSHGLQPGADGSLRVEVEAATP